MSQQPQIKYVKIDTLQPGTHDHNLLVKVVESEVVVEKQRSDGVHVKVIHEIFFSKINFNFFNLY